MYFSNKNESIDLEYVLKNKKDDDDFIVIAATEKLSQKYNFQLLVESKRAFNKSNIFSFNNYITNLYENTYGTPVIDELQYNYLIIDSIKKSSNKNNYNYIKQIGHQVNGFRRDGITASQLKDNLLTKINNSEFDTDNLANLTQVLAEYESLLGEKELIDFHSALVTLTDEIENNNLIRNKTIIFDEFILFAEPELNFLQALAKNNSIIINVRWDELNINQGLVLAEDLLNIGFNFYDSKGSKVELESSIETYDYDSELMNLKSQLQNTKLYTYSNLREEVYGVTKLVKYLLNKENYSPSDICVVSRQSQDYSLLFKEFFADNHIPTNINDRLELSKSPVITSIIKILEAVVSNFNFSSLEGVLSAPYLDVGIDNKSSVLNLAKKFRIIGGMPDKGFVQFIHILETRKNAYNEANKNNDSYQLTNEFKSLNNLTESFDILNKRFSGIDINKDYSPDEFVELLYSIISKFKVKESILNLDKQISNSGNSFTNKVFYTEKIESDSRALYKFTELIGKVALLEDSDTRKPLSELLRKLKGLLSITKFQIREKKKFGVDVTSIEQVRGLDYKVKILVGAVENKLPLPFGTDRLLGLMLPDSEERHYYSEFMQFVDFMNDDTKKYIFRYYENENQLSVDSHFLKPFVNYDSSKDEYIDSMLSDINLTENWQKTIINKRDTIDSEDTGDGERNNRIASFKNSTDLNVSTELTEADIQKILDKRTFSVSELNRFDFSIYNHFYERILGLETPSDIEIYFSNLELGNLIHNVTESTLLQYKAGIETTIFSCGGSSNFTDTFKIKPNDKSKLVDIFKATLLDSLGRYKNKHKYYELEKLYLLGDDSQNGILILWFEKLIEDLISQSNYSILAMEHQFKDIEIELDGKMVKFNGKVDRIDISDDRKHFKIIDYKTSKPSTIKKLQLVIYSEVVKKLLHECGYESVPEELEYFYFYYEDNFKLDVEESKDSQEKIYKIIEDLINLNYVIKKNNKDNFDSKEIKLLKRN